MKCYAVIYTDRWQQDFLTVEVWTEKEVAEKRVEYLNDNVCKKEKDQWGNRLYYYVIQEYPLNEEAKAEDLQ
jgi:hypothetical protein